MLRPFSGSKTVTTAGTRVQLTAVQNQSIFTTIVIQGYTGNTGKIFVGDVTVSATNGIALAAGECITISGDWRRDGADDFLITDFYIDAATNGDKAEIMIIAKRN